MEEMSRDKQIEGMAKILCTNRFAKCENCYTKEKTCTYYFEATQLYKAGYRKQEWISVDERLPEESGEYLVFWQDDYESRMCVVYYEANYDGHTYEMKGRTVWFVCDRDYGDLEIENITHWMPLPQPPKMKGGAE